MHGQNQIPRYSTHPRGSNDLPETQKPKERSDEDIRGEGGYGDRKGGIGGGQSVQLKAPLEGVASDDEDDEDDAEGEGDEGGGGGRRRRGREGGIEGVVRGS